MGPTEYEKYIRTEELLALQKREQDLSCPDELQFQVVHQIMELGCKLIQHEMKQVVRLLGQASVPRAVTLLHRVARMQRLLIQKLDLLDTMSPKAYMTVRSQLGRGSGQESPGFKMLLRLPGEMMWPALTAFLEGEAVTLREIYEAPDEHHLYYQLCEGYVDYDQLMQTWRHRHLLMVYRIIGVGTKSLKGKPSDLLARGATQRFFPGLWEVRDELFQEWSRTMLSSGKETGYHG